MLFLLDVAVPEHNACCDLITTELMHWLGLLGGCSQGFAIDGQVGVIRLSRWRLQSTRLISAAALRFPSDKEGGEDGIQFLLIELGEHIAVRHLAGHLLSVSLEVLCKLACQMANPFSRSAQCFFAPPVWLARADKGSVAANSACLAHACHREVAARLHAATAEGPPLSSYSLGLVASMLLSPLRAFLVDGMFFIFYLENSFFHLPFENWKALR